MLSPSPESIARAPDVPIHRLSVAQYERMAREGILTAADRVELLEGWLVPKMTKNPPHRIVTRRVRLALEGAVPGNWYVESQEPIVTTDSEPEPDVCVIRGRTEDYSETNPPSEAVGLVVEIAEASLAVDRRLKTRVYARASIPVYWIVDLATRCVEVHELPSGPSESPTYARRTEVSAGRLRLILDGAEVALIDLADLFFPEG